MAQKDMFKASIVPSALIPKWNWKDGLNHARNGAYRRGVNPCKPALSATILRPGLDAQGLRQ
jgi:hypothetical protein